MLCDKSSKTLKRHYPALKKEVIRCANSQVSLRQLYNNISGPRQSGSILPPWHRNTGFPPPAPRSQVNLKLLWKSHYWVSSLKELGLVQFSEKATPVCRVGFNSYRSRRLRDLHKVNYRKQSGQKSKWQDCRHSKKAPCHPTFPVVWYFKLHNYHFKMTTAQLSFLGAY